MIRAYIEVGAAVLSKTVEDKVEALHKLIRLIDGMLLKIYRPEDDAMKTMYDIMDRR